MRRANGRSRQATLLSNTPSTRKPRLHKPNTRDNASACLSLPKLVDLAEAVDHATAIGNPLNLFVTIHFEAAKLRRDYRAQDAIGRWLRLAGQWLRTKGITNTFVWTLEHATGTGEHVHLLIHCPPWLRDKFKAKAEGVWMEKAGMAPRQQANKGIKIERVGPRGYHPVTHTGHSTYERQLYGVLPYLLKGLDRDAIPANDNGRIPIHLANCKVLMIEPEYSNAIYGRRCSRSQNISAKARSQYQPQNEFDAA